MQSVSSRIVSSRIWTRIAVFISYGDNDYTTGTSTDVEVVWEVFLDVDEVLLDGDGVYFGFEKFG